MNMKAGQKLGSIISSKGQFDVVSLSNELIPGALRTMREFFLYQPFCAAFKIDTKSVVDLERFCIHAATDGVSVAAVDKSTGVLAASLFNIVHERPQRGGMPFFNNFAQNHCKYESSRALLKFFIEIDDKFNTLDYFNVDCVFETFIASTLPEYRNSGLIKVLMGNSLKLARDLKNGKYIRTPLEIKYENKIIKNQNKEIKIPQAGVGVSVNSIMTKVALGENMKILTKLSAEDFKVGDQTLAAQLEDNNQPITVVGMRL